MIAETDPERAEGLRKFIFEKNEFDEGLARHIPDEEVKYYPGSIKGRMPEDDPESYAKWLVEH